MQQQSHFSGTNSCSERLITDVSKCCARGGTIYNDMESIPEWYRIGNRLPHKRQHINFDLSVCNIG